MNMQRFSPEEVEKIKEEYVSQIVVPKNLSGTQYLLCPVGLVGAGKTTVVKPLAEKLGLVRISSDDIRKLLKDHGYDYEMTLEIAMRIAVDFLGQGYSLALDADCAGEKARQVISQAVQKFGVKTVWIHINPPEEFILNKLRHYPHTWLFKDADDAIANYRARKPLHEKLDMPFVYVFDTSQSDLTRQLEEGARAIEKVLN